MKSLSLTLLAILGTTSLVSADIDKRPCGFKIAPCPLGSFCQKVDPACDPGENCQGYCVPLPTTLITALPPKPTYPSCGGFRAKPVECPNKDEICIDDPYSGGCGMACDAPGICVKPVFCGGIAGVQCEKGKKCVDDPRYDCNIEKGGADCGGICV